MDLTSNIHTRPVLQRSNSAKTSSSVTMSRPIASFAQPTASSRSHRVSGMNVDRTTSMRRHSIASSVNVTGMTQSVERSRTNRAILTMSMGTRTNSQLSIRRSINNNTKIPHSNTTSKLTLPPKFPFTRTTSNVSASPGSITSSYDFKSSARKETFGSTEPNFNYKSEFPIKRRWSRGSSGSNDNRAQVQGSSTPSSAVTSSAVRSVWGDVTGHVCVNNQCPTDLCTPRSENSVTNMSMTNSSCEFIDSLNMSNLTLSQQQDNQQSYKNFKLKNFGFDQGESQNNNKNDSCNSNDSVNCCSDLEDPGMLLRKFDSNDLLKPLGESMRKAITEALLEILEPLTRTARECNDTMNTRHKNRKNDDKSSPSIPPSARLREHPVATEATTLSQSIQTDPCNINHNNCSLSPEHSRLYSSIKEQNNCNNSPLILGPQTFPILNLNKSFEEQQLLKSKSPNNINTRAQQRLLQFDVLSPLSALSEASSISSRDSSNCEYWKQFKIKSSASSLSATQPELETNRILKWKSSTHGYNDSCRQQGTTVTCPIREWSSYRKSSSSSMVAEKVSINEPPKDLSRKRKKCSKFTQSSLQTHFELFQLTPDNHLGNHRCDAMTQTNETINPSLLQNYTTGVSSVQASQYLSIQTLTPIHIIQDLNETLSLPTSYYTTTSTLQIIKTVSIDRSCIPSSNCLQYDGRMFYNTNRASSTTSLAMVGNLLYLPNVHSTLEDNIQVLPTPSTVNSLSPVTAKAIETNHTDFSIFEENVRCTPDTDSWSTTAKRNKCYNVRKSEFLSPKNTHFNVISMKPISIVNSKKKTIRFRIFNSLMGFYNKYYNDGCIQEILQLTNSIVLMFTMKIVQWLFVLN